MFLQLTKNSDRVEVLDTAELFDPFKDSISGRLHRGEELQDPGSLSQSRSELPVR